MGMVDGRWSVDFFIARGIKINPPFFIVIRIHFYIIYNNNDFIIYYYYDLYVAESSTLLCSIFKYL